MVSPVKARCRIGSPFQAEADGSFKLIVMPGRGVIGARMGNEHYRLGVGTDTIPEAEHRIATSR